MCRSVGPDETALLSSDVLQSVTHDSADKRCMSASSRRSGSVKKNEKIQARQSLQVLA